MTQNHHVNVHGSADGGHATLVKISSIAGIAQILPWQSWLLWTQTQRFTDRDMYQQAVLDERASRSHISP